MRLPASTMSTWRALAIEAQPSERFDASTLEALPGPAARWLTRALPDGTPLTLGVEVRMAGRIRLGRWMPFTADQILRAGVGFVWKPVVGGRLLRFVGPITIAPTIALIGLSLFQFGAPVAGTHWGIGGLTILLIILFSQILRSKHRAFELFPILLGMGGAWATAGVLTMAGVFEPGHPAYCSVDKVAEAAWIRVPLPFQWGMPVFSIAAIVGMLAGVVASIVESVGDYYACARLAGAPVPTAKVVSRGIGMEGVGGLIAGIIGSGNGTTSYSENIGAIGLTRVGSRRVVQVGAIIMIVLGTVAKFGALFTTIPSPVVGAAKEMVESHFVECRSGRIR